MRTTNIKTNYKVLERTDRGTYILRWNKEDIDNTDYASWDEVELQSKPTLQQIENIILSAINKDTDNKILEGFTIQRTMEDVVTDIKVYLSLENQFNYKASYDLAFQTQGASLPCILKFGEVNNPKYYQFTTLEDFTQFNTSCISFINRTLQEGWRLKDGVDYSEYEQLLKTI